MSFVEVRLVSHFPRKKKLPNSLNLYGPRDCNFPRRVARRLNTLNGTFVEIFPL